MSDCDPCGLLPPFSVNKLCIVDEPFDLTLMCDGKRFFVAVGMVDLDEEEESLKQEYLNILNGEDQVENWTTDALYLELVRLAPSESRKDPRYLQDYYKPEAVYLYKLVNKCGKVVPASLPSDSNPNAYSSPMELISNVSDREDLPLVDAAKVQIVPIPGNEDFVASDTPARVRLEGKEYYFRTLTRFIARLVYSDNYKGLD